MNRKVYTVEPHGSGWAIYHGRDEKHHGANLGLLTECEVGIPLLVERALNKTFDDVRCERDVAKLQASTLKLLVDAKEQYIKLLSDELNDLVGLAFTHGWKSTRYEEGKRLRETIDKLKELVQNE